MSSYHLKYWSYSFLEIVFVAAPWLNIGFSPTLQLKHSPPIKLATELLGNSDAV